MSDFREYLNEQLKNPEFKKEWDALEPEFNMIQATIDLSGEKRKRPFIIYKTEYVYWYNGTEYKQAEEAGSDTLRSRYCSCFRRDGCCGN